MFLDEEIKLIVIYGKIKDKHHMEKYERYV